MSIDYRPRRRRNFWPWIVAAVAILGFAGTFAVDWFMDLPKRMAHAEEWALKGPPCPTLTGAEFAAKNFTARREIDFGEVKFARAAGHVECNLVTSEGGKGLGSFPVCQFTSPAVVVVTPPGKAATYFNPGVGSPATVAVQNGVASCVMASNFRL